MIEADRFQTLSDCSIYVEYVCSTFYASPSGATVYLSVMKYIMNSV